MLLKTQFGTDSGMIYTRKVYLHYTDTDGHSRSKLIKVTTTRAKSRLSRFQSGHLLWYAPAVELPLRRNKLGRNWWYQRIPMRLLRKGNNRLLTVCTGIPFDRHTHDNKSRC